jgi:hypothetical protein|tara:strand:- start:450 stop:1172 length:723 start_codon:yes stop_codon:yes gene_type:complete
MNKFFKENIKYILQSLVVLLSVLLSFYIDSVRVEIQNANYKNEIVKDLQSIIENERIQIKNIKDLQIRCRNAADDLIYDITQKSKDLSDKEIAEKLLLLSERGSVSFFSQSSLYDELKNTGSTRLIKSDNFRYALSNTYNNLNQRNLAVSRIIDDYFFRALARINKKIIIFSKEEKSQEGYVYSDLVPTNYSIDKSYYYSNEFLGDLNQMKSLVERYLNMLEKLDQSYKLLRIYSEEELN